MGEVPDTAKKDPEAQLRVLSRTLRALRSSSKALVRVTEETSLLREVCRIIVEDCGHAMVWVGFAENDADKSVRPAAYSGFESGYLEALGLTWADTERGRGPTGRAIRTDEVCLCRNMLTDPVFTPWREEALRRGYASSIALPLSCNGNVIGALTLYSREPDPFSEDEIILLTHLADDLAFGICSLRMRLAHAQAEAETTRAQRERDLTIAFLRMVNLSRGRDDLLRTSALFFKKHAGCDAVGLRLKMGSDFPYSQTLGFSEAFLEAENTLCTCGGEGGETSLACLCGQVIDGNMTTKGLSCTAHGSFWSNDTSALLQTPFDFQDQIRGRCIHEGYGSVALLPLHDGPARLGLLQLNALRKGAFTPESLSLWERLSDHLAVAVAKFQADEALRAIEDLNRKTLQALPAHIAVVARDGRIINVNEAWAEFARGNTPAGSVTVEVGANYLEACRQAASESFADAAQALDGIESVLAGKRNQFVLEYPCHSPQEKRWFLMTVTPLGGHGENGAVISHFNITARKQAEEQMRFQSRLLDAVGQAVVSTDLDQRITYWNKTAATLFGWTPAEALGRNLAELTRPMPDPDDEVDFMTLFSRGETWSHEYQLHRRDGSPLPMLTTNAPVFDDQGGLTAVIGVGVDLTERKQTEELLRFLGQYSPSRSGEGFFQQLARYLAQTLAMDFVCIDQLEDNQLSAQTLAVFHNGAFEDNISYTLNDTPCGDVVGQRICCFPQNVCKLFPKDAVLQKLKAESYLGATLWNTQGKPIGLIAVIGRAPLENTRQAEALLQIAAVRAAGELERLRAESALRESEERYRLIFQNVQEGFYLAKPLFDKADTCCDAVYLEVNPAFERIMGRPRAQIIGKRIKELVPQIKPEWLDFFGKVTRTGEPINHQSYSETFRKHFEAFIFRPVPGQFAVIVADITTRKQFEQALSRLNAQLEHRVAARTEELASSNRELEAFCYSVSHDLRAPLRSMDGFSQALLEDYGPQLDADGQDFLNRIRSNCQRMAHLIDDLLHLSRLSRSQMRQQPVNLTALAHSVFCELRQAEPERAVAVRIAPGLTATGDPVLLQAALSNLLQNAWKFTGQRVDAVIEVGVMAEDRGQKTEDGGKKTEGGASPSSVLRPPSSPVFYVRDNGIGFDMQYADKLFTPFQRLHAVTDFPGSGIGLATVQRVINRHGGRVWAESAPGQGATFFFTIGAHA